MEDAIAKMRSDWDSRAREDFRYYIACERRDQPASEFNGGGLDISARIRRDVCGFRKQRPLAPADSLKSAAELDA